MEHLKNKKIPVWIRHVVIPNINDSQDELFRLGKFIARIDTLKALDVLPYHDMAKVKYENLGIKYPLPDIPPMSKEGAIRAKDIIMSGLKSGLKKQKN